MRLDATLADGRLALRAEVTIGYASTCPCSAALSRQLVEQGFLRAFEGRSNPDAAELAAWLRHHATLATPHSQRSEACVSVAVAADAPGFGLLALIGRIEAAVATPLQTAVKRADEQAFAALNGANLLFVEDAARRIQAALHDHVEARVAVRHLESLHPHDAVAWSASAPASASHGAPA